MKPVTAFYRFDKESQKWVHNHIEDGHKLLPEQPRMERSKSQKGYLTGKNNEFIAIEKL